MRSTEEAARGVLQRLVDEFTPEKFATKWYAYGPDGASRKIHDPEATQWCTIGFINRITPDDYTLAMDVEFALDRQLYTTTGRNIVETNDGPNGHETIINAAKHLLAQESFYPYNTGS